MKDGHPLFHLLYTCRYLLAEQLVLAQRKLLQHWIAALEGVAEKRRFMEYSWL